MSLLDIANALKDRHELSTVPGGEYKLVIVKVDLLKDKENPNAVRYLLTRHAIDGHEWTKDVSNILTLPGFGETEKEENENRNRLGDFFEAHNIDVSGGVETENLIGCEAYAILGDPVDDGKGYGEQNRVKKWLIGN